MIEVNNLVKRYGSKMAVDHIQFRIDDGEVVGFLGPNGAGKSTTMNILTGYISSTEGSVRVDGYDVMEDPHQVKRRIGFLPENPPLYMDMTVNEYLRFACKIKAVKKPLQKHIDQICEVVGIAHVQKRLIRNLSKGYKQRTGLAQALVGNPSTMILDEPTVGLDPIQIIGVRNIIKELGNHGTVILSSHILPEVQSVCKRVLIMNEGRICADGLIDDLSKGIQENHSLQIRVTGTPECVLPTLNAIEGVSQVKLLPSGETGARDYGVRGTDGMDLRAAVFEAVKNAGLTMLSMKSAGLTLEELFLRLTVKGEM